MSDALLVWLPAIVAGGGGPPLAVAVAGRLGSAEVPARRLSPATAACLGAVVAVAVATLAVLARPVGVVPMEVVVTVGLCVLGVDDLRRHRLPVVVVYPVMAAALPLLLLAGAVTGAWQRVGFAALGAVGEWLLLVLVHLVHRPGRPAPIAYGDVRLGLLLGLVTGWYGGDVVMIGIMLAWAVHSFVVVGDLLIRRKARARVLPFGASLIAGAYLALLLGSHLQAFVSRAA